MTIRQALGLAPLLCLLLAFVSGPTWPVDRGDTLAHAEEDGAATLRVLWVASDGWAQAGADGRPEGFTVDLMHEFARWLDETRNLEVELEWVEESDWRRFYARVRDGEGGLFGLGNVTVTEARGRELAFSPPYVNNVAVLIGPIGRAEIERPEQLPAILAGLRAMAFAGTLHEQRLRALAEAHWPEMPIESGKSNAQILEAVAGGTHFAYIDGYNYVRARAEGAPLRRHPALDDPGETFGVIMPLANDWRFLLEAFFAEAVKDAGNDWYRASLERHLGSEIAALMAIEPD